MADAAELAQRLAEFEDRLDNDPLFLPTRWRNHLQPMEATGPSGQPMEAADPSSWSKRPVESFAAAKLRLKHILDDVPGGPAEQAARAAGLPGWETSRPALVRKLIELSECDFVGCRQFGGA